MKRELIVEHYSNHEDGAPLFADGFDDAILGICPDSLRVVYSRGKCIEILAKRYMSEDEAIEFLEYNTFTAYVGKFTPIWVEDFKWYGDY